MIRHLMIWLLFLLSVFTVLGQDTATCPTSIFLAMSRANTACSDLDRNFLCYGNGTITVDADTALDVFSQQGDVTPIESINTISLTDESPEYSMATMSLQANLLNVQAGRRVTMLMYGDVELTNHVDVLPQVTLIATGLLNIRRTTEADGEIIMELPLRSNLTAIGKAEEEGWFRVLVPDTDELGWVNQALVNIEGDPTQLLIVDETIELQRPFQIMSIATTPDDAPCDGTPNSGVLVQTPNTDSAPVDMTINGTDFNILGTMLIHAQPDAEMHVYVLNGQVEVAGELVPSGAMTTVSLDADLEMVDLPSAAAPYTMEALAGVPINNLGYRVNIAPPTTDDLIQQFILSAQTTPTPIPDRQQQAMERCRHTLTQNTTAWAGPGTFYEVAWTLDKDSLVRPVLRSEVEGVTWYLLQQGGWINASLVEANDICGEVPLSEVVEYPIYNTLQMETCESTNGPIRAGQWLTITFNDGGWETLRAAERAPQVDPGRISVDTETYSVWAGQPIQAAPGKYYRTFSTEIEALPGTVRIIGQRLSYILSCDITIPAGGSG